MFPAVFLFDIDGTLISSGGAGRRAVEAAFARRHGNSAACDGFTFAGMTDRAIVRRALVGLGMDDAGAEIEAEIDGLLAAYLELLEETVREAPDYRVHDGVLAALDATTGLEGAAVGLGTGNVERGARIKLARAGLTGRFAFGGFGCDAEDRGELLRRGAERGAARIGRPVGACRVVVIGDTPRDIEAAHAIGAFAVAVATGPFTVDQLVASGADAAFADLTAPGALECLLG